MASELRLLAAVARISEALNTTLNLEPILQAVLDEVAANTAAIGGQLSLTDNGSAGLAVRTAWGARADVSQVEQEVVAQGRAVLVDDLAAAEAGAGSSPGAVYIAPVVFLERVAGLISLFFPSATAVTPETTSFVAVLANLAAIALSNLQRYEELTAQNNELYRRARQIERVVESSRVFHGESELSEVYEELVYSIQEGVGFNIVVLSLAEESDGEVFMRAEAGAGLPLERLRLLAEVPMPWSRFTALMKPAFSCGGAFFASAQEAGAHRDLADVLGAELYAQRQETDRKSWQVGDIFFIPLRHSSGRPLGMLNLAAPVDNLRPGPETARILEAFANHAAAAIENVLLYHNTREYARQLGRLQEVSQAVLSEQDESRRLQLLVEGLQAAGWQRVMLTLPDAHDARVAFISAGLSADEHERRHARLSVTAVRLDRLADPRFQPFRRGSCYYVPGESRAAHGQLAGLLTGQGAEPEETAGGPGRDALYLPINDRRGRPMALFVLERPVGGRRPDRGMLRLMELFARFAAATIENIRLVSELRQLNRRLDSRVEQRTRELAEESERVKILLRISTELTASLDKDRVLQRALLLINEGIGATQGRILLVEPGSEQLALGAAFDMEEGLPGQDAWGRNGREGIPGRVLDSRRAVIVKDIQAEAGPDLPPGSHPGHRSLLAVPLLSGEEASGVMMLLHREPDFFSQRQLELATAAAIQVAQAVRNAELYDLIRKQAESLGLMMRDAQAEVAKTHAILESIGDGVLVTQAEGEIILVNRTAGAMLGIAPERLLGSPPEQLREWLGDAGAEWLAAVAAADSGARELLDETAAIAGAEIDGRVLRVTVSPVLVGRRFVGTVSVLHDVTREAEVDRLKSEFVSTVSHELRTPMTSVKGYADLLLMGVAGPLGPRQEVFVRVIKTNADRLGFLVDDLLDISRIETGATEVRPEAINLRSFIPAVVEEYAPLRLRSRRKELDILVELDEKLPAVTADPEKLSRILTNLLDNAINYTPDGGQITVTAHPAGALVRLSIADNGIGIAEEDLPRIFERFFRADVEQVQGVPGTGLGLSIVRSLVEMQGGAISVESRPGAGSVFSFSLPVTPGSS